MARSLGLKLKISVIIGKAKLIDQVWLHNFHIVVFFNVDLALDRGRLYLYPWHMAFEIYHVCFLQSAFVTLHLLRMILACVRHHAVGLEIGS